MAGWRTVVVNIHSKLSYKNNHLIFRNSYKTEMIHLSEIDILLLETTDIVLTTMLVKRLVDENILVIFCDDKRFGRGVLYDRNGLVEYNGLWKNDMVYSPNSNNSTIDNHTESFFEKSQSIMELYHGLERFDPSNREGHSARIYFNTLFGNDFTRESDNDINAALDYGYTLLLSMFAREVVVCGCMTQIGLKHANQFNQFNLASDIMEPFIELFIKIDIIISSKSKKNFFRSFQKPISIMEKRCIYQTLLVIIQKKL